jgi:hypothetical protein
MRATNAVRTRRKRALFDFHSRLCVTTRDLNFTYVEQACGRRAIACDKKQRRQDAPFPWASNRELRHTFTHGP